MEYEDGGHLHTAVVRLLIQCRKGTSWLNTSYHGKSLSREIYAHGLWEYAQGYIEGVSRRSCKHQAIQLIDYESQLTKQLPSRSWVFGFRQFLCERLKVVVRHTTNLPCASAFRVPR
jgi:hypothetical protein